MHRDRYDPLQQSRLKSEAGTYQFNTVSPRRVRMDSPAIEVMTDLQRVRAVTLGAGATLDEANRTMIQHGVRLLFATDPDGRLVGMITANDLLGEKPVQFGRERSLKFDEIRVSDIMVPRDRIDVIALDDVLRAEVGHVVVTLKAWGRQHAVVVDADENGTQMVRGIFSLTQIGRQLGVALQAVEVARNFAEIEAAISG